MDEKKTEYLTVEEVTNQQYKMFGIAIVCAVISAIICAVIKFSIPIIIGIFAGCLVSIAFHFWLYVNLKKAINMEKQDAINYANIQSAIRKVAYVILLVALVANPIYKVNVIGLIIGVLEFRLIIYAYNLYVTNKKR